MLRALLIGTTAALLAVGCASTSQTQSQAAGSKVAAAQQDRPSNCQPTASRIADCSGPGRTYTQEDLQRTGQTNPAAALQMLDPSITAH